PLLFCYSYCSHMRACSYLYRTWPTTSYSLSLQDALPIYKAKEVADLVSTTDGLIVHFYYDGDMPNGRTSVAQAVGHKPMNEGELDRKSTRLNSSHGSISYAVFCLKKKINSQWIRTQDEAR